MVVVILFGFVLVFSFVFCFGLKYVIIVLFVSIFWICLNDFWYFGVYWNLVFIFSSFLSGVVVCVNFFMKFVFVLVKNRKDCIFVVDCGGFVVFRVVILFGLGDIFLFENIFLKNFIVWRLSLFFFRLSVSLCLCYSLNICLSVLLCFLGVVLKISMLL